ncbi:hypothetical protein GOV12_04545 [Candidatus Pacearchaeota archaeon]|nr:hypothetical protein [Candidatus Pacearchaeota archaeon]
MLIITSVENLNKEIINIISREKDIPGIYVSLNKTQKSSNDFLKKNNINSDNLFFIDCVTSIKTNENVLHIPPTDLKKLSFAIKNFIKEIKQNKYLIIDALSTLLIYNNENKVASFVKEITEIASQYNVKVIALSPKTKGEDLLNKIFNFFDKVVKK